MLNGFVYCLFVLIMFKFGDKIGFVIGDVIFIFVDNEFSIKVVIFCGDFLVVFGDVVLYGQIVIVLIDVLFCVNGEKVVIIIVDVVLNDDLESVFGVILGEVFGVFESGLYNEKIGILVGKVVLLIFDEDMVFFISLDEEFLK